MGNTQIRNQYNEFIFESFNVERLATGIRASFVYKLGDYTFTPSAEVPLSSIRNEWLNDDFLNELFFNFGIINAISYYKLSLAPKFTIKCGTLDENQKEFFKKQFYNGLGELMYVNGLLMPYEEFMTIEAPVPAEKKQFHLDDSFHGNVITVGGGKDSIVSLEACQKWHNDTVCMNFNRDLYPENHAALDCIRLAGYTTAETCDFNLTIDRTMLELNKQGFYNGHIPFSAGLAFATIIIAYLNNKSNIVLSNEASANEGNIAGTTINHQYSKSIAFENDFRAYVANYISDKFNYFSLLRCLNEYEIVQKFIKFPRYLEVFRSCNVGTKTNSWCGHCAKCLYVYIMLYPFVDHERLNQIFGHNLYDDTTLGEIFNGLVNPDATKPFECVGTRDEINYSVKLAVENAGKEPLPALLEWYRQNYNPTTQYDVANYFNPVHNIPAEYLEELQKL